MYTNQMRRNGGKFQDDKPQGRGGCHSAQRPSSASVHSNSLIDGHDVEPHGLESSEGRNDSNEQVANQLLVSFGSQDTSTFVVTTIPMTVFPFQILDQQRPLKKKKKCMSVGRPRGTTHGQGLGLNSVGSGTNVCRLLS
jgi:hypothetical protein